MTMEGDSRTCWQVNEFLTHRLAIEDELVHRELAPLEHTAAALQRNLDDCTSLLNSISTVSSALERLKSDVALFDGALGSLREDADLVRLEHERLAHEVSQARAMLEPFTQLDAAARQLNSAGVEASVAAQALRGLATIAGGLEAASRTGIRDAAVYTARLQQLRSRALGILRAHISHKLRGAANTASEQLKSGAVGSGGMVDTSAAQIPFHAVASTLRPLIAELELHADTAEYVSWRRWCGSDHRSRGPGSHRSSRALSSPPLCGLECCCGHLATHVACTESVRVE